MKRTQDTSQLRVQVFPQEILWVNKKKTNKNKRRFALTQVKAKKDRRMPFIVLCVGFFFSSLHIAKLSAICCFGEGNYRHYFHNTKCREKRYQVTATEVAIVSCFRHLGKTGQSFEVRALRFDFGVLAF